MLGTPIHRRCICPPRSSICASEPWLLMRTTSALYTAYSATLASLNSAAPPQPATPPPRRTPLPCPRRCGTVSPPRTSSLPHHHHHPSAIFALAARVLDHHVGLVGRGGPLQLGGRQRLLAGVPRQDGRVEHGEEQYNEGGGHPLSRCAAGPGACSTQKTTVDQRVGAERHRRRGAVAVELCLQAPPSDLSASCSTRTTTSTCWLHGPMCVQ